MTLLLDLGCKISRRYSASERVAYQNYEIAIQLCPGFIRPCELMGNIHRKEGRAEKAIELFTRAAEPGSTNYKLYYLLARLLFEKGDLAEANRNVKKSLSIRADCPKAVELNREPICGPWFPMPHGRCTPLFGRLEGEGEFLFFVAKEK